MPRVERAIISVYDKTGLEELARGLHQRKIEILSSGGTARHLAELEIPVTPIAEYTGSPEILGGRVKTLHPRIFGGILARNTEEHRAQITEHKILPIDLVVVNLYPFEETARRPGATRADIIEMIDIGGPSLIRAAAKNHERVAVVVDPADYGAVLEELEKQDGAFGDQLLRRLAAKAFGHTSAYDAAITAHMTQEDKRR
jgi:phosphoribosylaminoimidazolecarboxamide formyltransferase/IMP cyclohydrolase